MNKTLKINSFSFHENCSSRPSLCACLSDFSDQSFPAPYLSSLRRFSHLNSGADSVLQKKLAEVKGSLRPWRAREDSKLSEFQVELIQLASQLVGDHLLNSYPDIGKKDIGKNMTVSEGNKYAEDAVHTHKNDGHKPRLGAIIMQQLDLNLVKKVEAKIGKEQMKKLEATFVGPIVELSRRSDIVFFGKLFHFLMLRGVLTKGENLWSTFHISQKKK